MDKDKAIRFVSEVTHEILHQYGNGEISKESAEKLILRMKENSFLSTHNVFFTAVQGFLDKISNSDIPKP